MNVQGQPAVNLPLLPKEPMTTGHKASLICNAVSITAWAVTFGVLFTLYKHGGDSTDFPFAPIGPNRTHPDCHSPLLPIGPNNTNDTGSHFPLVPIDTGLNNADNQYLAYLSQQIGIFTCDTISGAVKSIVDNIPAGASQQGRALIIDICSNITNAFNNIC